MAIRPMPASSAPSPERPQFLTERQAAKRIGMSAGFLAHARIGRSGTAGPAFVRLGRTVRYLTTDLDVWLAAHRVEAPRRVS